MPDHRTNEQKAAEILALRLEIDPQDIYWPGYTDFEVDEGDVYALWTFEMFVRNEAGQMQLEFDEYHGVIGPLLDTRSVRVPLELYQEFLNHVENGTPDVRA